MTLEQLKQIVDDLYLKHGSKSHVFVSNKDTRNSAWALDQHFIIDAFIDNMNSTILVTGTK